MIAPSRSWRGYLEWMRNNVNDLPKIYAFKDDRQKEIMLNRNFARVNREIDEMIKSLLNSV